MSEYQKTQERDKKDRRKFFRVCRASILFSNPLFTFVCVFLYLPFVFVRSHAQGGLEYSMYEVCEMCSEGGGLTVACDGCSAFFHLRCMDLVEDDLAYQNSWTCPDCKVEVEEDCGA
jgi:hypothetical protein